MFEHDDIPWMLETIKWDIKSWSGITGGAHNARPLPAVNQQLSLGGGREKQKDGEKDRLVWQFLFFLMLKSEGIKRETLLWNFKKGFKERDGEKSRPKDKKVEK